jgi:hypothetical protein
MRFSNTNLKKTKGGSVILKNKMKKTLQPSMEGGAILSNRMIGITSNPSKDPPIRSMASIGGMLNFNKSMKTASKKKDREENIKFVY